MSSHEVNQTETLDILDDLKWEVKYRCKGLKGRVRRNALNAAVTELSGKMMKFTAKNAALL